MPGAFAHADTAPLSRRRRWGCPRGRHVPVPWRGSEVGARGGLHAARGAVVGLLPVQLAASGLSMPGTCWLDRLNTSACTVRWSSQAGCQATFTLNVQVQGEVPCEPRGDGAQSDEGGTQLRLDGSLPDPARPQK